MQENVKYLMDYYPEQVYINLKGGWNRGEGGGKVSRRFSAGKYNRHAPLIIPLLACKGLK
jgi:hypothetical protein